MSEFERYTPPEARPETEATKLEKPALSPETKQRIQDGPPTGGQPGATSERIHWRTPDGNLITPEKEEIYRSPETLPEKEPGYGPKASHSDDPGKTAADDPAADDHTADHTADNQDG
jgi:hypothetical protein